jgi:hypothetical protein
MVFVAAEGPEKASQVKSSSRSETLKFSQLIIHLTEHLGDQLTDQLSEYHTC